MRFKSKKLDGFQVFAVSGVNTISFGIAATDGAKEGLLGFAVERQDIAADEKYYMQGFKVFRSVIPQPTEKTRVSTYDHPVQSLVWDDFTAKPGHEYEYTFHPLRGKPKKLDRSARPITIKVETEQLYTNGEHDIFFNRGVASSQAYAARFDNMKPEKLPEGLRKQAYDWLARDLEKAILKFIERAGKGDALLCCFYEFRYQPVADALKGALDRGVDVRIIVDAKENAYTDDKGAHHDSFPRTENERTIRDAKLPAKKSGKQVIIKRQAKPNNIQHNKFMVLVEKKERPTEVWTGSTNISTGGMFGQTNVGHWVRNEDVAAKYKEYWELLITDPGAEAGDDRSTAIAKNAAYNKDVEALLEVPTVINFKATGDIAIPTGVTPVFSPRQGLKILKLYFSLVHSPPDCSCITLAFGINETLRDLLLQHTNADNLVLLLSEKEDRPNPRSKKPFRPINASNNVYKAWGSFMSGPVYAFAKETNTRRLEMNLHVSYIHSKFLLMAPLGKEPIVVTGSANFSNASTNSNDENMLIIRGDLRVADIYFTEFNRLFNHYYFRAVVEATRRVGITTSGNSRFLEENDTWTKKYDPGTFRSKRLELYTAMYVPPPHLRR
jgi:phosphatidylserine/phosphatidylglycerophosphate/cardiolipin synthase-like enzyme